MWKKEDEQEAERVGETKKTKMLITGLKSDKFYSFEVRATNAKIISQVGMHGSYYAYKSRGCGSGGSSRRGLGTWWCFLLSKFAPETENKVVETAKVITGIASIPFSILFAPVIAPATVIYLLKKHRNAFDNYIIIMKEI